MSRAEMVAPRFVGRDALPTRVREVNPPVAGLYVLGAELDLDRPRVAIVGARESTAYGIDMAHLLGEGLARHGVTVVSGMARGVDSAAHRGALAAGSAPTIAVLAGGVDVPYPASSRDVYDEIVGGGGCVVSEEPPGAQHRREGFVKRNRIIAALADALVLVQAIPPESGALKTVELATELGVDVLAVPGDARSPLSAGPHDLIREGSMLCARPEDVLVALGLMEKRARTSDASRAPIPVTITGDERSVLEAVTLGVSRTGELGRKTGLDPATLARVLTRLELNGWLRRTAGGYERV